MRNGQIGIADTFTTDHVQPTPDTVSNVQILNFDLTDGVVSASFARPLETGDDKDKSLATCQTFQFPVSGGIIQGTGLNKHSVTPKNAQVCDIATKCAGVPARNSDASVNIGAPQTVDQNGTSTSPIISSTDASNITNQELSANQSATSDLPLDGTSTTTTTTVPSNEVGTAAGPRFLRTERFIIHLSFIV